MRRVLAYCPGEGRIYRLLGHASTGPLGVVPFICLLLLLWRLFFLGLGNKKVGFVPVSLPCA